MQTRSKRKAASSSVKDTDAKDTDTKEDGLIPVDMVTKCLQAMDTTQSFVFSPFSFALATTVLYHGTQGKSHEELGTLLGRSAKTDKAKDKAFLKRIEDYNYEYGKSPMLTSNRVLSTRPVGEAFANHVTKALRTWIKCPMPSTKELNDLVCVETHGLIPNLFEPDALEDVDLVLLNVVALCAQWEKKLVILDSKEKDFPAGVTVLQTPQERYTYMETDEVQMVLLPFVNPRFGIVIALPTEEHPDAQVFPKVWAEWSKATPMKGTVTLPKFKVESMHELIPMLQKMGLHAMFESPSTDLEPMMGKGDGRAMDTAFQKASLTLDETGVTAAAATVYAVSRGAGPPTFSMVCNRSFWYVVVDMEASVVLFVGRHVFPSRAT
jgi:serine protease inhibitor